MVQSSGETSSTILCAILYGVQMYCALLLSPTFKADDCKVEQVEGRAARIVTAKGNLSYKEEPEELGWFSPAK